jgi:hypothetical protein
LDAKTIEGERIISMIGEKARMTVLKTGKKSGSPRRPPQGALKRKDDALRELFAKYQ